MIETATLARPYANAVFGLARSNDRLPEWSRTLSLLVAVVGTDEGRSLIGSPTLPGAVKARRLIDVVGDVLDDQGRRFVQVLADNKRLDLLPEIALQYETLKAAAEKVFDVQITAAVELSREQMEAYEQALERHFGQAVEVTAKVDAELIGGAIIRAGDTVIDGTVRGRLGRLMDTLARA